MRVALGLLASLALVAAPQVARAEFWGSALGDLLHEAQRIEVIDVAAVKDGSLDGVVVAAIRSVHSAGDPIHIDLGTLPQPAKGDRVLVVCDTECPRAIGIDRAGGYRLIAQQPGDGALVTPNFVEHDSVELLAAGKPAPELCVRGTVELLDETARPGFEVHVGASDGTGTGQLAGGGVGAALATVWFASREGSVSLTLERQGRLELVAPDVVREHDGCYGATFLPSQPLARTRAAVDRALAGTPTAGTIGRGLLDVAAGAPVRVGKHVLRLAVTRDGSLELASDLAKGPVSRMTYQDGTFSVAFPARSGSSDELEIVFAAPSLQGYERGVAVAKALRDRTAATAQWLHDGNATPLGPVQLTYVRER